MRIIVKNLQRDGYTYIPSIDHVYEVLKSGFYVDLFWDNNEPVFILDEVKKKILNSLAGQEFRDVHYGDMVYCQGKDFVVVTRKDYDMIEAMKHIEV